MAWQLETWLRLMVYVELRATRTDWEEPIRKQVSKWPPSSLAQDKRLHHMATRHQAAISYLTFSQLWDVIKDNANWPIFEPYFPPKDNVAVRIDEIKSIRNRVAHFREPHLNDIARIDLFMRDLEDGLRRFCNRYATGVTPAAAGDDPITDELEKSWASVGYGVELWRPNRGWLYAEPNRQRPRLHASLEILRHANSKWGSLAGVIYKLSMHPGFKDKLDTAGFIDSTTQLHKDIVHIMVSHRSDQIAVTVPAIHGVEYTAGLLGAFITCGAECCSIFTGPRNVESGQPEWPEYVLCPDHLLMHFDDAFRQPILELTEAM